MTERSRVRRLFLVGGVLGVLLLTAAVIWNANIWRTSERVTVSARWSVALEQKSLGSPFAEYRYRVRRYSVIASDTVISPPLEIAPNGGGQTDLCLYKISAPNGALFLEFLDRMERSFVELEPFARVPTVPDGSQRRFVGEFVGLSPDFVPAASAKRCPHERAA